MSADAFPPRTISLEDASRILDRLVDQVSSVFRGKEQVVRWTVASAVGRGHVLLEDVPGVGKTTLALALARSLGLSFQRVQFTSDLLPGDIVGVSMYSQKQESFTFRPGPIFAGLVLADEINRTTPRTQSALLEAMSEGRVSVDEGTYELPKPFLVLATQNPLDHHGTYPLPESQLDRFMVRLSIGYPTREVEREIVMSRGLEEPVEHLAPVCAADELRAIQALAAQVRVDESLVDYVLAVAAATRSHDQVRVGVSTRGVLAMMRAVRALALMEGRTFAVPDDARELFVPTLAHRLSLVSGGQDRGRSEALIAAIVAEVPAPV
ncbi:ATPase [Lujinxingia litoralis]|uniref:ATPase n=1 Tax=Lujinxingia litoralis TaxID=2211119 RepID=A0A328C3Y8_9DELT|nr:MoxR family ATPase [Lujinxingia litoralis]RAL21702.1 ATPase [Lujinxingia litoralis]